MTHRRGNGLLADSYESLMLLPSALADTMLDALRREGIAAYAVPLAEEAHEPDTPPGDTSEEAGGALLDAAATDRLYVDANERAAAMTVLRSELPDHGERTLDGDEGADTRDGSATPLSPENGGDDTRHDPVWEDLVARFYSSPTSDPRESVWPDAENIGHSVPDDTGRPTEESDPPDSRPERSPSDRAAATSEDEDHFIPPPPPPLPTGDLTSRSAWGGLFGGPTVLLLSTLLGVRVPDWLAFCAIAAFIAGFIVLVVRMGDRPPRDSGPDDGAVV